MKDHTINNYGKELINLCQAARIRIAKGCIGKDKFIGQYTCFSSRSCSVVAYLLATEDISQISLFN